MVKCIKVAVYAALAWFYSCSMLLHYSILKRSTRKTFEMYDKMIAIDPAMENADMEKSRKYL